MGIGNYSCALNLNFQGTFFIQFRHKHTMNSWLKVLNFSVCIWTWIQVLGDFSDMKKAFVSHQVEECQSAWWTGTLVSHSIVHSFLFLRFWSVQPFNAYNPWDKPFRGDIRPPSSPHVFLLPKNLNLKKKSGGHLSAVAFVSERPLTENIYTFLNVFAATFDTTFKSFNFIDL